MPLNDAQKLELTRAWVDFVADRLIEGMAAEDLLMAVEVIGRTAQHEFAVLDTGLVETVSVPDDVAGVFAGRKDETFLVQRFVDLSSTILFTGTGGPTPVLRELQEHIVLLDRTLPR